MTDLAFIAIVGAVPATLTAAAGLIVSLRNGQKANVIHTLVNSNLTKVKDDLEEAKIEIRELKAIIQGRT